MEKDNEYRYLKSDVVFIQNKLNNYRSREYLEVASWNTFRCLNNVKVYLIRLGILVVLQAPDVPSTRDLVMNPLNLAVTCFQMLSAVNPEWRYSIYCLAWYLNSNRIAAVSWASDDTLPLVPLADAFVMDYTELFWRIIRSKFTSKIVSFPIGSLNCLNFNLTEFKRQSMPMVSFPRQ